MRFKILFLILLFSPTLGATADQKALQIVQESSSYSQESAIKFIESLSHTRAGDVVTHESEIPSKPACKGRIAQVQASQDEILIFVSFSIPDEALKTLFKEAQKYKARLVMRGLIEDSFKKTQKKLQALQINVDIDPNLFEEHKVTHVPTFIKVRKNQTYKLQGNVSLSYASEQFEKSARGTACAG